jgi:pimeloyl-ACP methyl ester carboxylesterase
MDDLGLWATAVLGHSFGGKVALVFAANPPEGLQQAWVIDSDPSAGKPAGDAWQMLQAVRALPSEFPSREEAIAGLERFGFGRRIGEWMTTNLERNGDRYQWRLDFDAVEALLADFSETDLWSVVQNPPPGVEFHFVKATESDVLGDAALMRLEAIGRMTGRVTAHRVQGGHLVSTLP